MLFRSLTRPEGRFDVHMLIYEVAHPGTATTEPNVPMYVEFCEYLQTAKIIEPPAPWVLRKILARAELDAMQMADKAKTNSMYLRDADRLAADVDVLRAALEQAEARARSTVTQTQTISPDVG